MKALLKALATISFLLGFCQIHKFSALLVSAFKACLKYSGKNLATFLEH